MDDDFIRKKERQISGLNLIDKMDPSESVFLMGLLQKCKNLQRPHCCVRLY